MNRTCAFGVKKEKESDKPPPFLAAFEICTEYIVMLDKLKCQNGYQLFEKEGKKNSHYRQEIPKNGEG
jgi:hypothetical protein